MSSTPSGVKYVKIPGRYLKGTAREMRGALLYLPAHIPFGVICMHDMATEIKFRLAFDMVIVANGLIKAYSERAMLGINEDGRFQVRTERHPKDKPNFLLMDGKQDVIFFRFDCSKKPLKPSIRREIQAVVISYVP